MVARLRPGRFQSAVGGACLSSAPLTWQGRGCADHRQLTVVTTSPTGDDRRADERSDRWRPAVRMKRL